MDIWDVWDDKEKSPARVFSVKGHTLSDRPFGNEKGRTVPCLPFSMVPGLLFDRGLLLVLHLVPLLLEVPETTPC